MGGDAPVLMHNAARCSSQPTAIVQQLCSACLQLHAQRSALLHLLWTAVYTQQHESTMLWQLTCRHVLDAPQAADLQSAHDELEAAADQKVPQSLRNWLALLPMLTVVVVQDALELAEAYPRPLAHQLLLGDAQFRWVGPRCFVLCSALECCAVPGDDIAAGPHRCSHI